MLIEAIVQNEREAMEAKELGADRLELVSKIEEGGLTPSYDTIKQVLRNVSIPVQVMIRPHSCSFFYDEVDKDSILKDIEQLLNLGTNRIVIGALNQDNTIDVPFVEKILTRYNQLDITFHRAFDDVTSQVEAYKVLVPYKKNLKRILTSGGESDCWKGRERLSKLVELSRKLNGPAVLPGAGITALNFQEIHAGVGAKQYHFGSGLRKNRSFSEGFDKDSFQKIIKIKRGLSL
ncbi:copper homeostasis protein CutC (plasmid) [Alkalihalophilus pseudofirmus]|uniref:copper homeostasis protein CutC n=1 Tax=Alkalihalophilus pseudofirmus TaxID=79885 RepID=UPI00259B1AEC|nr:copper homeostasis protein CutC [Alkalihalophilus pseudofirmus]WEG19222.1 copper homeostasis protein CutC [Alkalihalophilus pseudofirmus]